MTALAPTLQAFFVSRLGRQRDASPHTVDSYRHAFRLLLAYAQTQAGKRPSEMDLADLDAVLVSGFPDHLEDDRGSSVPSRNTRLAAIHSFFRFASYRHPEHAETIQQVLAIPRKKTEGTPRSFLTRAEMDAVAAAPDLSTSCGRRDHVLLVVALRTGLRLGSDQLGEDDAERLGDGDVVVAEADENGAVAEGDLAGGHGGDPGELLAVEPLQAPGGPVGQVEAVVVEQPRGQGRAAQDRKSRPGRLRARWRARRRRRAAGRRQGSAGGLPARQGSWRRRGWAWAWAV